MGGQDVGIVPAPIPANARVESYVPFDRILSKVDAFVTNGGFGAVNEALSKGVPIVIGGITQDKPFVAARISWTGTGINLGTERPTPEQIQTAVRTILADGKYRRKARSLQASFAQYAALGQITKTIYSVLAAEEGNGKRSIAS